MLRAGACQSDITPGNSTFLYGYPHVSRDSTGVHDPLLSSSLYLDDGGTGVLLIACDVIFLGRDLVNRAAGPHRRRDRRASIAHPDQRHAHSFRSGHRQLRQ